MNSSQQLTFIPTQWTAALSVLVALVTAGLCFAAWRRSGYRKGLGALELLRLVIVTLAVIMFNQPEWVEEFRPEEKPVIAVLWDGSASMTTRDATPDGKPTSTPVTRAEAIAPLIADAAWQSLQENREIVIEQYSAPQPGHGTDLYAPLAGTADKYSTLLGIVLLGDGDWNEGPPPVQAAARLRTRGIPVFTVPVGSPNRLPDVELLSFDAPTFGVAGKAVRVPFTIESSLPREYATSVTLKTSDGDEVTKEVRVPAMGRTTDWLVWKPKGTGDVNLTLDVPKHADETIADNNRMTAPISIREEKLKVLIVESTPRWEYRYIRNALSRDPGVELSCLLFHTGLGKVGGGNKDYIKQFPAGLDELSKFDVVFLGDVGLEDGLTTEQCRLLRGLVERQASGLVLIPGFLGKQLSLLDTELGDLFPVQMDLSQPGGWGSRTPGRFELTEAGRRSLLTKLADTQEENADVWEDLPGFQWYAPVARAKAGAEVLAVHKEMTNEHGRVPLLVTRTFGAGKVLLMATDGAWRWRKGVEDKYHYRFWGQVVRWMAYQRNMAKGETMRLFFTPDQPRMRQTLTLNANVIDRTGEPLVTGDVLARVTAPSGKLETVQFTADQVSGDRDEWGMFRSKFTAQEPGRHAVTLSCKQTGATLETSFFVQGVAAERIGKPARPEVLEEIARVTGGKVLEPGQLSEIVEKLAALPEPPPSIRRVQLWSHPLVAGGMIGLLGLFWILRKGVGLI